MPGEALIEVLDQRRIVIPQGPLTRSATDEIANFVKLSADLGYALVAVAARQKDIGSQRDPNVVTEAVVLTFQKPTP